MQRGGDDVEGTEDEDIYSDQEGTQHPSIFHHHFKCNMAAQLLPGETLIDFSDDEPSQSSLQDFLQPLQETADRVSQQVEEFAKQLHKFNTDRASDDQTLWEDAWTLLDEFRDLAQKRAEKTSKPSPRPSRRRSTGDGELQLAKIELEADLWQLTRTLLVCKSPKSAADAKVAQEEKLSDLHRYSTNVDVWNAFLDSDLSGQEYESILDWLQERVNKTDVPIQDMIQQLTNNSERGDGVWSAGPMFTKNSIKQKKRGRGIAGPLEAASTHLSLATNTGDEVDRPVVSQLDLDAQTRQNARFEVQDNFHEEAAWITCWELLRRGKTLNDVRSWWAERNEQWRSLTLRGCSSQLSEDIQSPWYRIMSLGCNPEWLAQCRMLCKSDAVTDPYQRAVYGLLCGDLSVTLDVCELVDEGLFASFNALLVERYQSYLSAYQKKLADGGKTTYYALAAEHSRVSQMLRSVTSGPVAREEMQQPQKAIQMAAMGFEFDSFLQAVGRAAADVAYSSDDVFRYLMEQNEEPGSTTNSMALTAGDHDSVRILAHLQIILKSLGLLPTYKQNRYIMENNIANYIGWLQKDKKWNLIPIYASRLSKERVQTVLGTIFIDITDDKERSVQIRLLKKYKIDVADVLYGIFALANYQDRLRFGSTKFKPIAPRITEPKGSGKAANFAMVHEFMGQRPSPEAERIVSSVEWYRYVDAPNWGKACYSVSFLYKLWLCEGNFEALKLLPDRVNLADISLNALGMNLMFVDDAEEAEADVQTNGRDEDGPSQALSPGKSRRLQQLHPLARGVSTRKALYDQSLVWMQLEQLVTALDALNSFQVWADDIDTIPKDNMAEIKGYKHNLRKSFQDVQLAMQPLLGRDFLCQPTDEKEANHLDWIRNHYLTECIIGYNSVLYFAGHSLSRSHLVECMDLAQIVAQTPSLTQAFVDGGKMRELVRSFALDSQSLLLANEQPKKSSSKKEKGLEIWQVQWKDGVPVDLDELD